MPRHWRQKPPPVPPPDSGEDLKVREEIGQTLAYAAVAIWIMTAVVVLVAG
jgi:hypothetical protein